MKIHEEKDNKTPTGKFEFAEGQISSDRQNKDFMKIS